MKSNAIATTSLCLTLSFLLVVLLSIGMAIYAADAAFDSDEYIHATPSLDLYQFASRGNWSHFQERLSKEVFYPPFHSLVIAGVYSVFGPSPVASRLPSLFFFFFSILLIVVALSRSLEDSADRTFAYTVAILFAVSCPIALFISVLVMLEPLGMLLTALLLYIVAMEDRMTYRSMCSFGLCLALLFLTKHTYGILILPGLLLSLVSMYDHGFAQLKRTLRWGGGALIFAGVLWGFWLCSVDYRALTRFLFNHHARGFAFGVEVNTFYFRSLLYDFHIVSPLAVLGMVGVISSVVLSWNKLAVRFCFFSCLLSFVLFGFISEQGARHVVILAPFWWYLVGNGAASFFSLLERKWSHFQVSKYALVLSLCVALSVLSATNLSWYEKNMKLLLESKPEQDRKMKDLLAQITPGAKYSVRNIDRLAFPYHLSWLVAARDGLTVAEARLRHIKKLPAESDAEIQILTIPVGEND